MVRPVAQDLFNSLMWDVWPRPAAQVDFGLKTQEHYEALQGPVRTGEIHAEDLDRVLGNGWAITELVRGCSSNPHKQITFVTDWDLMGEQE